MRYVDFENVNEIINIIENKITVYVISLGRIMEEKIIGLIYIDNCFSFQYKHSFIVKNIFLSREDAENYLNNS